MSKETEYKYFQTDDTVDIGKNPLPLEDSDVKRIHDDIIKNKEKILKQCRKSNK